MKFGTRPEVIKHKIRWLMIFWLVALVGFFSPWISRKPFSAALNWNAYDLYDAVMRLPEIETGVISVKLQTLRAPLLGLAVLLVLHVAHERLPVRVGAALLGAGLAFMTFPPYPIILTAWRTPGWLVPFWWAGTIVIFCATSVWLLPRYKAVLHWFIPLVAVFSVVPAATTLSRLLPALRTLHNAPVGRGYGFWMTELGVLVYAIAVWSLTVFYNGKQLASKPFNPAEKAVSMIETVKVIKARYESQLLNKPNVVAVGVGMRAGYPDPVIVVSVSHKIPEEELREDARIPESLEGVVVCVEEIGEPHSQIDV